MVTTGRIDQFSFILTVYTLDDKYGVKIEKKTTLAEAMDTIMALVEATPHASSFEVALTRYVTYTESVNEN